jgi:hypothetical protein
MSRRRLLALSEAHNTQMTRSGREVRAMTRERNVVRTKQPRGSTLKRSSERRANICITESYNGRLGKSKTMLSVVRTWHDEE